MGKTKRILSFILAMLLVLTIVPANAIVWAMGTDEATESTKNESKNETVQDANLPSANVEKLESQTIDQYKIFDLVNNKYNGEGTSPLNPQVLMQFVAKDTPEEAAKSDYADYTTDFYITVKGVNDNAYGKGCYLIGHYGEFGWVVIPLDEVEIENTTYPVITSAGHDFSYEDICTSVVDFKCGIFFSEEFLAANPGVSVSLDLGLSETFDKAQNADYIKVGQTYTYTAADLGLPSASVSMLPSQSISDFRVYDLIGGGAFTDGEGTLDPQVLMEFLATEDPEAAAKNVFANYYADFYINITGLNQPTAGTGCYLIGHYEGFGWIAIPLDEITVENTKYPVISAVGTKFTYLDICTSVKDFKCGIYFSEDFLAANPDMEVSLELGLSKTFDDAQNGIYTKIGDTYTYDVDDLTGKSPVIVPDDLKGDVVEEIKNSTALEGYVPENVPAGAELVIELVEAGKTIVFDVAPMANGEKVENLEEAITFRLPVPASVTIDEEYNRVYLYAKVYHEGEYIGTFDIKGEGNGKYVEISSKDFSEFEVKPVDTFTVAHGTLEIGPANSLAEAIECNDTLAMLLTFSQPGVLPVVTLNGDYTITEDFLANGDYSFVLDLNGKTLTVAEGATLSVGSNIQIIGTGSVVGDVKITDEADASLNVADTIIVEDMTVVDAEDNEMVKGEDGTFVSAPAYVAQVGDNKYTTLTEALAAVKSDSDTVVILADITENLTGAYLRGNITTVDGAEVTITLTNTDWVYCPYTFVLGENITLKAGGIFYYAGGAVIKGTVVTGAYYQRYAGTKLYIEGSMTVTGETFIIRLTDNDANAGIYVDGGTLNASVIYFYQGMISGTNGATLNVGTYWQTNETDGQGSANLVLDNSTLTVTVYDYPAKATGNSTVTLKNGSIMNCANGGFTYGENAKISIDATSSLIGKNGVAIQLPVAQIGNNKYATLADAIAAAQAGDTIIIVGNVSSENVTVDKNLTITADTSVTLDSVSITISGTEVELTVSNLKFTGSSYINANNGKALTVTGVTADVEPTKRTGRAAFIVTGTSELTHGLKLVVKNCVINSAQSGTDYYSAAIFGWRYIADGSEISGNTFGTEGNRYTFVCVKTMNAMDGATITVANNTIYGTSERYVFLAFDLYQNCSRANAYTVVSSNNTIDATVGSNPVIVFNISGNTAFADATNVKLLDNGTILNGNAITLADIDATEAGADYDKFYGVNVTTDADGKIISGTFNTDVSDYCAEGFIAKKNSDGTYGVAVDPAYGKVAKIGDTYYATLADAIAAAQAGDVIEIIADLSDIAIVVDKNLTIKGNVTLNNVSFNANGADELTVIGLTFTGNSWINSGTAEKLTVSGVTANVTPSNTAYTNSRSAFISLGRSEQQLLTLTIENCNIVSKGGSDPVLGWASITEATITGSTFGAADAYQTNSDSIKFMSVADGAIFNFVNNTVYSNYNGIVIAQNTTRNNSYTATFDGNTFYGAADHIWLELSVKNTYYGNINAKSNNTINGNAITVDDIKTYNDNGVTGYAGIDVVLNDEGKVIGGTMKFVADGILAEGYELDENGVVTFNPAYGKVAQIGDNYYATLEEAFKAATNGCTIEILADVTVDYYWDARNTGAKFTVPVIIDGNGHTITFTNTVYDGGNYMSAFRFEADATVKDLTIDMKDAISGFAGRFRAISAMANLTVENCTFIGNGSANNTRAIIFGEGASTINTITITDCEFTGWRRGVSDNETGNDVAVNVTITGSTFTDAAVAVSATGTVTFTGNTVSDAYVDIRSYTENNTLNVTATGNTLEANTETTYNYIKAGGTVNAQDEFVLPKVYVAQVGEEKFESVIDAILYAIDENASEVKILSSVREVMPTDVEIILNADLKLTADSAVEVKFYNNGTAYDFIINSNNYNTFTIGENVTFQLEDRVIWLGYYGNNVTVAVNGTLAGYQIWHGADTTVGATGTLMTTGEALVMRRGATMTVNGGKVKANYFNILAGNISAKNGATIECGAFWIDNTGSYAGEGGANISIWNSTLTSSGNLKSNSSNSYGVSIDVYESVVTFTDYDGYGACTIDANTTLYVNGEDAQLNVKNFVNNGIIEVYDNGIFNVSGDFTANSGAEVNVEDGTFTVAGTTTVSKNLFISGSSVIKIENLNGRATVLDGTTLTDSYIKSATNGTTRVLGDLTIKGGFSAAYIMTAGSATSTSGYEGTITIDTVLNASYGVEMNGKLTLNGGLVKLSGGNANGAIWGCVFQSGTFVINSGIEVIGNAGTYAPIYFTDARATINSTITQKDSHGEPLYIGEESVVTFGTNAVIDTLAIFGAGKIIIDATGMSAGEYANVKCGASGFTGTLEVINNDKLEAKIVNGKIVLATKPVAMIGTTGYATFEAALAAAQAGDTIELLADITASAFIGIDKSITINGNDHKITSSATRVFRVTTGNVEVTLNDVNMVNTAVRVGTNDIRGISIDSVNNVKLTLNNCSVDFTDASATDWSYAVNVVGGNGYNVTVNGGTYEGANVVNVNGTSNTVVVKNATLNCLYPDNDMYYGACIYVAQDVNSSVVAEGNTFNGTNAIAFNVGYTPVTESNNIDNTKYIVAKIDDTYYTSLAEAIAAAQAGETVTLLQNVTLSEIIVINKAITLDGNGKTIASTAARAINVSGADGVTIKNLTINCTGERAINIIQKATNVTIDNVTATASNYTVNVATSAPNAVVTIKNSNLTGLDVVNVTAEGAYIKVDNTKLTCNDQTEAEAYAALILTPSASGATIEATNITFNISDDSIKASNNTIDGVITIDGETDEVRESVAYISYGDNAYAFYTLAAAIETANAGDTIVIIRDIKVSETVVINKSVTIDLNGKVISGTCNASQASLIYIENGAELTVKDSAGNGKITYAAGASTTGWTIDVKGAFVLESGTIELTGTWGIGYAVDVRPNAWGTAYTAPTVFTMNGGNIVSSDGGVRVASSSSSTYSNVSASFVMNGGTIEAAWDGVFIQQSDAIYDVLSFTMNDGTIKSALNPIRVYGPDANGYVNGQNCMSIVLAGGEFEYTGTETYTWVIDGILRVGGGSSVETIVNNGTVVVSAEIAATTAPEGYKWVANDNGTYTLAECNYVAQVGDVKYESLQEALNAGGEVVLLADVTITSTLRVSAGKTVVLDLNGKTIDGIGNVRIAIMSYGNLTIKDTSAEQNGTVKAGIGTAGNAINICAGTFTFESGNVYSLNNAILIDEQAANVYIKGGNITAEPNTNNSAAFYISSTSATVLEISGGTMIGQNGILLWNNTTITISGGSITATALCGVQGNGSRDNTSITISGGEISGAKAGIYHPQGGELTITGGSITGGTGIVVKGGTVNISGGTIAGTGEAKPYAPVGSGYESTGDGLYVENYDDSINSENYGLVNITVTGGTFTSVNGKAVASYANTSNGVNAPAGFISGGVFSTPVAEDLCAEGYIPTVNNDGTYGVKVGKYVAQIGETKYETFADALAAAQAGDTIVLLAPVVVAKGETLTIDKNVTITYTSTVMGEAMITNNGTLIIDKATINYNYVGAADNSYGKGNYTIENMGNLTIDGGKITIANISGHAKYPINNNSRMSDATLVINGGHLYNYNTSAIRMLTGEYKNSVTINGGKIEGYCAIWVQNPGSGTVNAQLTINGGEIKSTAKAYVDGTAKLEDVGSAIYFTIYGNGGSWDNNSFVKLLGGTFNENVYLIEDAPNAIEVGKATFNGYLAVPVAKIGDVMYASLADALAAAQAGDTIVLLAPVVVAKDETLTIDKDVTITYTSNVAGEDMFTVNGNLVINNGTIVYTNTDTTASNVTVSTISAGPGSTVTINGGTVKNDSANNGALGIYAYAIDLLTNGNLGDVTVTINGGTVYSTNYMAIRQFNNGTACKNTLVVTGGTIYGAKRAIQVHMDNNAAYTTIRGGKIEAGDYALCLFNTTAENLSVTGGEFVGEIWFSGTEGFITGGTFTTDVNEFCADGFKCVANANGTYSITECEYVAQVGDNKYESLAEAFANANGGTVVLLADIAIDSETITIANGANVTLDMNGKKITVTDNKAANVCYELFYIYGELTVTGDGTIELTSTSNDTAWAKSSSIFHNRGGELTIENGTFKHLGGTAMAFVVDNSANSYGDATTTINGGTLTSTYIAIRNRMEMNNSGHGKATLNVNGGTIDGTSRAIWAQASSPSLTAPATGAINISGGTIGLIDTARNAGAISMTTISGGTVAKFKGEVEELTVTGGTLTAVEILTADGAASDYAITSTGLYTKAVATVNGVNYATLAEAIAVGGKVTLIADATVDAVIEIAEGNTVELDLNGYTINAGLATGSTNHIYVFHNYGTLTITGDGVINTRGIFNYGTMTLESGTINAIDCNGGYAVRNYEGATFTMNGGTIATTYEDGDKPGDGYDSSPVRVDEGATFIMNDGTINNISNFTCAIDNYGTTTINGGTFTTIHTTIANSGTMTINGGTFTCDGLEGVTAHAVWAAEGTLTINGGTFNGKDNYNGFNVDASEGAVVYIKGGNFLSVHSGSLYGEGTIVVSGGTFFDAVPEDRCAEGYIPTANNDGTYGVKVGKYVAQVGDVKYESLQDAIDNANGETVVVLTTIVIAKGETVEIDLKGQTVTMVTDSDSVTALILNNGNLTVKDSVGNGKLSYKYTGTKNDDAFNTIESAPGSVLTIEGGIIENLSENCLIAYAIDGLTNGGNGDVTVNIKGGTITSKKIAVRIFANSTTNTGYLNISGGEIYGRVIVQSSNANANKAELNITGGTFNTNGYKTDVLYVGGSNGASGAITASVSGGAFNGEILSTIATGFITNGTFVTDVNEFCADGFKCVANANGTYSITECEYVAQVGDVKYESLQEALNAGGTVVLLTDIELTEGVIVADETEVILDLNGYTISTTINETLTKSFALITNNGTLTIDDTVGGGKVSVEYKGASFGYGVGLYTISNAGGTLTVENGTIENLTSVSGSMYDAIDNNSTLDDAIVNINGGEIYCDYIAIRQFANSTTHENIINVKDGGEIEGGNCSIWTQNPGNAEPKASIAIEGGNFTGRVLVGESENFNASIAGGTFTTDVSDYCTEGYECKQNADGSYGVVEKPTINVGVAGLSLTLTDYIKLNYRVNIESLNGRTDLYAEILVTHKDCCGTDEIIFTTILNYDEWRFENGKIYVDVADIAAKHMGSTVSVQFFTNDGEAASKAYVYSIEKFAYSVINSTSYSNEFKTAMYSLLVYGAEAQRKFGHATDNCVDADLGTAYAPTDAVANNVITHLEGLEANNRKYLTGANLTLVDSIELNWFLKYENITPNDVRVTVEYTNYLGRGQFIELTGENGYVIDNGDGRMKLKISGVCAADLMADLTIKIYVNGELTCGLIDSVARQCNTGMATIPNDKNLYQSILNYSESVEKYFSTLH